MVASERSEGPAVRAEVAQWAGSAEWLPLAVPVLPHQLVESLPLHHPRLLMMSGTPVDSAAAYTELTEQFFVAPDAEPRIRALDVGPRQFQFDSVDRHIPHGKA